MRTGWMVVMMVGCGSTPEVQFVPDGPPADIAIDAFGGDCSLLTQQGCRTGEKCTWINTQDNPPMGRAGCAPDVGSVALGSACMQGPAGPMGYDDCTRGTVCLAGVCKQFCDAAGGAPMCSTNFECSRYANFAMFEGVTLAGVCDPGCDPLTQDLLAGTPKTACGSTNPSQPTRTCIGKGTYSCATIGQQSNLTKTDRAVPFSNSAGAPYANGCAPGFIPLVIGKTGSMTNLCAGLCAALEVDNTPAHAGNAKGNSGALAKLPLSAAPLAGDGTCDIGKKGSHASSTCRFIWPYVADPVTGMLPARFENGPLLDTLGVCHAIALYSYDANNDGTPETAVPDCATLPPRSTATPNIHDDAADWGCQKRSNSQFVAGPKTKNPALADIRIGSNGPVPVRRHTFD